MNGVLLAVNEAMEWLLPWWYKGYSAWNTLPVAFVDLGLSEKGKAFCREKGTLISLNVEPPLLPKLSKIKDWKYSFKDLDFLAKRNGWYLKPFALQKTPFDKTLWMDVDCEVLAPLNPLFHQGGDFYIALETEGSQDRSHKVGTLSKGATLYNSGVILYTKNTPIIDLWIKKVQENSNQFFSDQHTLSEVLNQKGISFEELNPIYNWRLGLGINLNVAILHWCSDWGKDYIKKHGGIGEKLEKIFTE